jgi:hypothetical protein
MSRLLILGAIVLAVVAFAGTRPTIKPQPVHAATTTPFGFTGAEQTFPVPAGVSRVRIEVFGGRGAPGCNGVTPGGNGGNVAAIVPVTPGSTLFVNVGGNGVPASPAAGGAGGFNGGGSGGTSTGAAPQFHGGGGGGATDVRTVSGSLATRLIVAGGGGGGGGCGGAPAGTGGAGATGEVNFAITSTQGSNGGGPNAGTGGFNGPFGGGPGTSDGAASAPTAGVSGLGGTGGSSFNAPSPAGGAGGGGGAGLVGGGGGGAHGGDFNGSGGGGGGSGGNFVVPGATVLTDNVLLVPSARITVLDPPVITKTFAPASVAINGVTDLIITVTNPNPAGAFAALTNISFTDNFAAQGLVITSGPVPGPSLCTGTITATAGTSTISLTNGTIPGGASCQIRVQVRATLGGTQVNTTDVVSAAESGPGGTANATLAVASTIPSITKAFSPTSVLVGSTSTMTLTLTNPNPVGMTGVAFTDNFAALGLVLTSAAPTGAPLCTGTITATTGTSLVSLTGGTLAANTSCQIVVTVRANNVGNQLNTTSTLTSNEFAPGAAASASLAVTALATLTPTATPTLTPTPVIFVRPQIPQVFQHVPQGIFNGTRNNTPTPVRQAVAPVVANPPAAMPVLRPPSTGDAGLLKAVKLPFAW